FNRKIQAGGKTHRSYHAQPVLFKTRMRTTDGADHAAVYIPPPPDAIDNLICDRIIDHSIDRKVAPKNIFVQTAVAHVARPPAVQIRAIVTKTCNLEWLAFDHDQDDAKLRAHRNGFGENLDDVVGLRVRRDIIILRRFSEQHIAHTPARQIAFVARVAQTLNNSDGLVFLRHRQTSRGYPSRERSAMKGDQGEKL